MADTVRLPAQPATRVASFADLRLRIVSAVVLGAVAIGSLLVGGIPFVLFWLLAAWAVNWEWQRIVGEHRRLLRRLAGGVALCVAAALTVNLAADFAALAILAGGAVVFALAATGLRTWSGAGVLYAGALIVAILMIRPTTSALVEGPFDVRTIVWLFAVVWGTDIGAYFAGRAIGGPKVWPAVSPGKTWSGTLVGIACGALAGLAVAMIRPVVPVSPLPLLAIGLVAAAASQAGDFLESGVKRRFGVKDSSGLIPGHGGVMDRLDGFITAAALIALLAVVRDSSSVGEALFRW